MTHVLDALMPSFFSFFAMLKPFVLLSTTNAVIPLYPRSGCRLAKTMKKSASTELVIQILEPLILYPSAVFSALVFSAKASEPEAGSDRQNEPTVSVASFGSHFRFDSWVPYFRIAVTTKVL